MLFRLSALAALALFGCSKTTPDSKYPPPAEVLPVAPMPEKSESGSNNATSPAGSSQAASAAPKPIEGTLPASPPSTLARSHKCAEKSCKLDKYLPDPAFAKSSPAGADSPGSLWLEEIAAGSSVMLPRHHKLELVAVVISGDAVASSDEGGAGQKLAQWSVVRAPGVGIALTGGSGGAKIVIGLAAKTGTLGEALDQAAKKPFEVRWLKRPGPMTQASLSSAKDHAWGGGAFHARIAYGGEPAIPASIETLQAGSDALIKEHDHTAWEHIAILEGAGTMKVAGQDQSVANGSIFDIAPGTKHAFTPNGQKPLLAVQMYTPSGPEQRFVKLADDEAKKEAPVKEPAKK